METDNMVKMQAEKRKKERMKKFIAAEEDKMSPLVRAELAELRRCMEDIVERINRISPAGKLSIAFGLIDEVAGMLGAPRQEIITLYIRAAERVDRDIDEIVNGSEDDVCD